jgi:hypothetical protein
VYKNESSHQYFDEVSVMSSVSKLEIANLSTVSKINSNFFEYESNISSSEILEAANCLSTLKCSKCSKCSKISKMRNGLIELLISAYSMIFIEEDKFKVSSNTVNSVHSSTLLSEISEISEIQNELKPLKPLNPLKPLKPLEPLKVSNLNEMTSKELKTLCRIESVSMTGKRDELIQRLKDPLNNKRGSLCSQEGNKYELLIHKHVLEVKHIDSNLRFNTQSREQLGGSSHNNDLECNFKNWFDIGIEIKKMNTPDWMQTVMMYDNNRWDVSQSGKISLECREIFRLIMYNHFDNVFEGKFPKLKGITYDEWLLEKHKFKDEYYECPDDTISKLYAAKGCQYIQISSKGLYHLSSDTCQFGTPLFSCPQKLRIRIKVHCKKNSKGLACLSVMLSCLPKKITDIKPSPFSLDNRYKLPKQLIKLKIVE